MVQHSCWRFEIPEIAEALRDVTAIDDLFRSELTSLAERTRADPTKSDNLVLARLDGTDDELWSNILSPSSDDFGRERSAAARLMLVLVDRSVPAGGIGDSGFIVEEALKAVGWGDEDRTQAILGAQLANLFESRIPWLESVAHQCRHWLSGGWLDMSLATAIKDKLEHDTSELEAKLPSVAERLSGPMYSSADEISRRARAGIQSLLVMLSLPESDTALWVIQD